MEQEHIIRLLNAYKGNVGRCEYIQAKIRELARDIERAKGASAEDLAGPAPMSAEYTGRFDYIADSITARAGISLADGYTSGYAQELEREATRLQEEYETKSGTICNVEAWMKGLGRKHAWIIERFYFDGLTYAEIGFAAKAEFGAEYSKYVLRRMRREALDKICEMAR
jgi:hypothetical protein